MINSSGPGIQASVNVPESNPVSHSHDKAGGAAARQCPHQVVPVPDSSHYMANAKNSDMVYGEVDLQDGALSQRFQYRAEPSVSTSTADAGHCKKLSDGSDLEQRQPTIQSNTHSGNEHDLLPSASGGYPEDCTSSAGLPGWVQLKDENTILLFPNESGFDICNCLDPIKAAMDALLANNPGISELIPQDVISFFDPEHHRSVGKKVSEPSDDSRVFYNFAPEEYQPLAKFHYALTQYGHFIHLDSDIKDGNFDQPGQEEKKRSAEEFIADFRANYLHYWNDERKVEMEILQNWFTDRVESFVTCDKGISLMESCRYDIYRLGMVIPEANFGRFYFDYFRARINWDGYKRYKELEAELSEMLEYKHSFRELAQAISEYLSDEKLSDQKKVQTLQDVFFQTEDLSVVQINDRLDLMCGRSYKEAQQRHIQSGGLP